MVYRAVNFVARGPKLLNVGRETEMIRSANSDNSGSARAARLRRISAAGGPIPAVRPNIGSMALDAQLGKAECCNCAFNWTGSPIQLTYQTTEGSYLFFTAVFANAAGQVVPAFGYPERSECGDLVSDIEPHYSNNAGFLSVIYKILNDIESYIPATITQEILLTVTCEGVTTTYSKNITFMIPVEYQTACL
jgi:hypothetical protein